MKKKSLSILGATGSIGLSTLGVARQHRDKFQIKALVAGSKAEALADLAIEFQPEILVLVDEGQSATLKACLGKQWQGELLFGQAAVDQVAQMSQDLVVAAIPGIAGLSSTFAAVKAGNSLGLANKESMVCAGPLLLAAAAESGAAILPLDSEHSAIFQCLEGQNRAGLRSVTLTASGGPFRGMKKPDLNNISPSQALKHPNWSMGLKVTIDSATLFNKGLEYLEAAYLFDLRADQLDVLVHPQSIVHSFVTFVDGSSLAQMGIPDMQTPIATALAYPERLSLDLPSLSLQNLTFEPVDHDTFNALRLAREALEEGGQAPIVFNAANEVAVTAFLDGKIPFLKIGQLVEEALSHDFRINPDSIEAVFACDQSVRQKTNKLIA